MDMGPQHRTRADVRSDPTVYQFHDFFKINIGQISSIRTPRTSRFLRIEGMQAPISGNFMNRNTVRKILLPGILLASGIALSAGSSDFLRYTFLGPFAANPEIDLLQVEDSFFPEDRGTRELLVKDINKRFENAPDFTHQIALAFARGEIKATHAVTVLDEDLLADTFKSDVVRLPGGREIATTSSLLSEAVRSRDHTAVQIILQRLGVDYPEAQRIALGFALNAPDPGTGRHRGEIYLRKFAEAGGSATTTRLPQTRETLAELLAHNAPELLLPFIAKGFNPWTSMDLVLEDIGGISLGEVLALSASEESLRGLEWLLKNSDPYTPDLRAAANTLANLENRLGVENIPENLEKPLRSILQSQQ